MEWKTSWTDLTQQDDEIEAWGSCVATQGVEIVGCMVICKGIALQPWEGDWCEEAEAACLIPF